MMVNANVPGVQQCSSDASFHSAGAGFQQFLALTFPHPYASVLGAVRSMLQIVGGLCLVNFPHLMHTRDVCMYSG